MDQKIPKIATELKLMQGSPADPQRRVTLANCYQGQAVRWSFKNIPQLVPCAEAYRGKGPVTELAITEPDQINLDINDITFTATNQQTITIADMLNQSYSDAF